MRFKDETFEDALVALAPDDLFDRCTFRRVSWNLGAFAAGGYVVFRDCFFEEADPPDLVAVFESAESRGGIVWTEAMLAQKESRGWADLPEHFVPDKNVPRYRPCSASCRPADYRHQFDRGTVNYGPRWRNYSLHKTRIRAGTVVRGCNFAQHLPGTDAVQVVGVGEVTFIECNLSNVLLKPGMVLGKHCNTTQAWRTEGRDAEGGIIARGTTYLAASSKGLSGREVEPANARKPDPNFLKVR